MSEEDKLMKNKLSDIVEYIRHSTAVLENLEERIDIFSEIIDKKNKELLLGNLWQKCRNLKDQKTFTTRRIWDKSWRKRKRRGIWI